MTLLNNQLSIGPSAFSGCYFKGDLVIPNSVIRIEDYAFASFAKDNSTDPGNIRSLTLADTIDYMDNISVDWLPTSIGEEGTGSHNGDNYIAYTF